MSMLHRPPSPPPDSRWSSIRPHRPRLLLTVLDVDSVSVTFTLTATLDAAFVRLPPDDASLHRLRTTAPSEAAHRTSGHEDEDQDVLEKSGISQILRSGMAVKVNGERWQKVIIDTVSDADGNNQEEGIVTIYGLLPKQTYDIDLVVAATDETYGGVIVTDDDPDLAQSQPVLPLVTSPDFPRPAPVQLQTATPESTPPASPRRPSVNLSADSLSLSTASSPSSHSIVSYITLEERLSQLRASLQATVAQRDAVTAQLRNARKESQKTDNAMRTEIEALKRAAEKNAGIEGRNKRKVQSAQRVVAQLTQAAADAEEQIRILSENLLPALDERIRDMTEEHAKVREEADRSAIETEEALRSDSKRALQLSAEIKELDSSLERTGQSNKELADSTIPDLEKQLAALLKEIDDVEKGSAYNLPLGEFNHEADYPHHYHSSTSSLQSHAFQPFRNGQQLSRSARPSPIQRPALPVGNAFSSSQRSLESIGPDGQIRGGFYPNNAYDTSNGMFPQLRHPSTSAHPSARGLFASTSGGLQKSPYNHNRRASFHSSSSSLSLGRTHYHLPEGYIHSPTGGSSGGVLLGPSSSKRSSLNATGSSTSLSNLPPRLVAQKAKQNAQDPQSPPNNASSTES